MGQGRGPVVGTAPRRRAAAPPRTPPSAGPRRWPRTTQHPGVRHQRCLHRRARHVPRPHGGHQPSRTAGRLGPPTPGIVQRDRTADRLGAVRPRQVLRHGPVDAPTDEHIDRVDRASLLPIRVSKSNRRSTPVSSRILDGGGDGHGSVASERNRRTGGLAHEDWTRRRLAPGDGREAWSQEKWYPEWYPQNEKRPLLCARAVFKRIRVGSTGPTKNPVSLCLARAWAENISEWYGLGYGLRGP